MRFQAVNRCLMASVWWASDFRLSTLGLILVRRTANIAYGARRSYGYRKRYRFASIKSAPRG